MCKVLTINEYLLSLFFTHKKTFQNDYNLLILANGSGFSKHCHWRLIILHLFPHNMSTYVYMNVCIWASSVYVCVCVGVCLFCLCPSPVLDILYPPNAFFSVWLVFYTLPRLSVHPYVCLSRLTPTTTFRRRAWPRRLSSTSTPSKSI